MDLFYEVCNRLKSPLDEFSRPYEYRMKTNAVHLFDLFYVPALVLSRVKD